MIIVEELEGGLKRRHSDKDVYIAQQDGSMYAEAIDILDIEYHETDIPIDGEDDVDAETALRIITTGEEVVPNEQE